jgi:hypothetical protein
MTPTVGYLAATWFMVGLIWVIQVVHYPLFNSVGSTSLLHYERRHTTRMAQLLLVPATLEVALALWLVVAQPPGVTLWAAWAAGALLAAAWVLTLLVQVPLHRRLSDAADPSVVARLVRSNWMRTGLWTARGALAAVFLV